MVIEKSNMPNKTPNPYLPQLHMTSEINPSLPLHDPKLGWVPVRYHDGSFAHVDLSQLLIDAHKIENISFDHVTTTAGLYRILLSIIYAYYQDTIPRSPRRWNKFIADLARGNQGFDPEWVNGYFTQYHDRFYLIHSHYPFLQDASLVLTHSSVADSVPAQVNRKAMLKGLAPVGQGHPLAPSTNYSIGEKVKWGLFPSDPYAAQTSPSGKVQTLFTSLMYNRYAHTAIRLKNRSFLDSTVKIDDYTPLHSLRCTTQFIPDTGSLYKNLVLSMTHVNPDELLTDLPEWEWDVHASTGLLGLKGHKHNWYDVIQSLDAPRSSVNMTHMSILFVPMNHAQANDMPEVQQFRRVAFNFKHLYTANEKGKRVKMASPNTWNPFVAHLQRGSILRQTEGISDKTALSNPSIFRVAMLPASDHVSTPLAIRNLRSREVDRVLGSQNNASILVHAGDLTQDMNYNSFTIPARGLSGIERDARKAGIIDQWLTMGNRSWAILNKNIQALYGDVDLQYDRTEMNHAYWGAYSELFNQAVEQDCQPIGAFKDDIMDTMKVLYRNASRQFVRSNPLKTVQHENIVLGATHNWIMQQEGNTAP